MDVTAAYSLVHLIMTVVLSAYIDINSSYTFL